MLDPHPPTRTSLGLAVSLLTALLAAPPVFVALCGAGLATPAATAVTGLITLGIALVIWIRSIHTRCASKATLALFIGLTALAGYRLCRLSLFMHDAENSTYALRETSRTFTDEELNKPFLPSHNCFTCYVVGAHLADTKAENIYDRARYRESEMPTPVHDRIGETFSVDQYQYPPPFLLLPRLLMTVQDDFFALRSIWFGLNVLVFVITAAWFAAWVSGGEFTPAWLVIPALLSTTPTLGALQIGNAHFLIICISALAMLALHRKRTLLGATLLAYATLSKLFPGVLVLYLLARGRFRDVVAVIIAMAVLTGATLAVFGPQPFVAFVHHQLPALVSGKAFFFAFTILRPMVSNSSIAGIPFKLDQLDLLGEMDPQTIVGMLTWTYTAVLAAIAIAVGLRHRRLDRSTDATTSPHPTPAPYPDPAALHTDPTALAENALPADPAGLPENPMPVPNDPNPTPYLNPNATRADTTRTRLMLARLFLAILVLAQLRSPFLPAGYGNVAVIWLVLLLLPARRLTITSTLMITAATLLFQTPGLLPFGPPDHVRLDLAVGLGATALALALATWTLASAMRTRPTKT